MAGKVWFLTGASRGFGRIWAEAALERGDFVAATSRKIADLEDLTERFGDRVLPLALDFDDTEQVKKAVAGAMAAWAASMSCSTMARMRGTSWAER